MPLIIIFADAALAAMLLFDRNHSLRRMHEALDAETKSQ